MESFFSDRPAIFVFLPSIPIPSFSDPKKIEQLRQLNLKAVEIWESYNQEGEKIQEANETGLLGEMVV